MRLEEYNEVNFVASVTINAVDSLIPGPYHVFQRSACKTGNGTLKNMGTPKYAASCGILSAVVLM